MQHQQQQQRQLQQQQQYYANHPTQAVQGRPRGNTRRKIKRPGFASRATMAFAILQFIFGGICVILGITAIFIECSLSELGTGIWCGVMFAVAGSFGMAASLKKTNAMIITTMVLSIISAIVAGIACYLSSGIAVNEQLCYYSAEHFINGTRVRDDDYYDCDAYYGRRVAVDSILGVVAFAELVTAILQSAFCCGAYCCNQKSSASTMYVAVRTSEGGGQGLPMGVNQSEPAQQMTPSGLEFVPHYPNQQQGNIVNSSQKPIIPQLEPQPGVVCQQGQGHQLPQQQPQLQQRQQMLQLQPQQLQYQPQQSVQAGTVDQQLQGWRKPQPQSNREMEDPQQPEGKVTGPDVNVNQHQVQSPPTSSSVREDMSAILVENEVPLA
ncbi:uncharacterized protein [Ptychodera flava]|uniref:uncharacterized protein n=1 Tax=Ptychodera flava TaxID=63121 RepID=UPI00396A2E58